MFNRFSKLLTCLALPGMLLLAQPAAAEIGSHTFKFAAQNQKGHPQVQGMEKFADIVSQKSGGKMTVKLLSRRDPRRRRADALGSSGRHSRNVDDERRIAGRGCKRLRARRPAIPVRQCRSRPMPSWTVRSARRWRSNCRQGSGWSRLLGTRLPAADQQPPPGHQGRRHRRIEDPRGAVADLIDLFNGLGANAGADAVPRVYTALETGTVDGQENPSPSILTAKLNEVQKYIDAHQAYLQSADRSGRQEGSGTSSTRRSGKSLRTRRSRRVITSVRCPAQRVTKPWPN